MKKYVSFLPIWFLLLLGCASTNGFEDGRSLGKGVNEIKAVAGISRMAIFEDYFDGPAGDVLALPNITLGYARGLRENVDFGVRLNIGGNLSINTKYQFYGSKVSTFAMSTGFDIGTILYSQLQVSNLQLPLYTSYNLSDQWSVYANPRYIRQFDFTEDSGANLNMLGVNFGLMAGRKNKFGFDIALFNASNQSEAIFHQFTFNLGGKLRF